MPSASPSSAIPSASTLPDPAPHGLRFERRDRVQTEAQYLQLTSFVVTRDGDAHRAKYDVVERKAVDAAVVVPYYRHDDQWFVRLRTVIRPPLALRGPAPAGTPLPPDTLWEVPAGLIEPDEDAATGAARELFEELAVHPESMLPLGPPMCPAPAVLGEMHVYFAAKITPPARGEPWPVPAGDGSLYEENAAFVSLSLADALAACRRGEIWDAKTELALRRLAEHLS